MDKITNQEAEFVWLLSEGKSLQTAAKICKVDNPKDFLAQLIDKLQMLQASGATKPYWRQVRNGRR